MVISAALIAIKTLKSVLPTSSSTQLQLRLINYSSLSSRFFSSSITLSSRVPTSKSISISKSRACSISHFHQSICDNQKNSSRAGQSSRYFASSALDIAAASAAMSPAPQIGRLSSNDPSSFSNPELVRAKHLNLDWHVDFGRKVISGNVNYVLEFAKNDASTMVFDTRDLHIKSVTSGDGEKLEFNFGEAVLTMGKPLTVNLPSNLYKSENPSINIEYETSNESTALQWLSKEQTLEKISPFLFSQCQAIHARSLFPCQDTPSTKATYSAKVTAPSELTVLMSAVRSEPTKGPKENISTFEQKIAIPSYLIAIVVGSLGSVEIGPRSHVWAEKGFLKAAAYDFEDTEKMIKTGEGIFTPYVWGVYDILVLPPSFPFGGMENPCLTFATPTLLAGDKSLADVIAHEISHSWFGNLVTNRTFEDFWLNEGFTVFAERKIAGRMHGEPTRQFASICGWKTLASTVETLGSDNQLTCLTPDLTGVDPDDAFSSVPYEKGYVFLYYLEEKVGGPAIFEKFLQVYINTYSHQSIATNDFKDFFLGYFKKLGKENEIKDIDWDKWLKAPGMPIYKPKYDSSLLDACVQLKDQWTKWDINVKEIPFQKGDLTGFDSTQIWAFLTEFLEDKANNLGLEKMKILQTVYDLNNRNNCEIRCVWLRLCIKEKWLDQLPLALKFVNEQGRMKYIRPIYRDLYAWEEVRGQAIDNFRKHQNEYMYVAAYGVSKDLHITL